MKKFLTIGMVIMLLFLSIIPAFADAASYPMDSADFYVYVATPDGGLNLRDGPGVEYHKVIEGTIPDGVKLHITFTSGNWGFTNYEGNYGWVALKQTSKTPPAVSQVQQVITEVHTQGVTIVQQVTEIVTEVVTVKATEAPAEVVEASENFEVNPEISEYNPASSNLGSSNGMFLLIGLVIFLIIVVAVLLIVIINKSKKN